MSFNFESLATLVQNLAVLAASIAAIIGINSWRKETKWKRKYELAEEVMSLFYDARERLQIIRNPMGHVGEGKSRKRKADEKEEESEILDRAFVVHERFDKEREPFIRLRVLKYRFMVMFGKSSSKPFEDLVKLMNDVFFATNRLGRRYWQDQGRKKFTPEQEEKHLNEMHKYESWIWANPQGNDEIRDRMDEIIRKIEGICSEIIRIK